jgi:acyl-coenzyme A thioesterase PaaI-like protein
VAARQRRSWQIVSDNPLPGPANRCFACGPDNPIGLKIAFALSEGDCVGRFTPREDHVGYDDTVHGGIIFAALDDVMANLLYLQGIKAHTARCEIRYRRVLRVGETIELRGRLENRRRRLVTLRGEARLAGSCEPVADCTASFMLE